MMKTILESALVERIAVNTMLAVTLMLAATANVLCLVAYL